jgi:hypothetical protein
MSPGHQQAGGAVFGVRIVPGSPILVLIKPLLDVDEEQCGLW